MFKMSDASDISVVDVYDIVTDFAKEFRPIIEMYGPEPFNSIMSKVLTILEHLEAQTMNIGKLNTLLQDQEAVIMKLEKDKADKAADRQRYEKELEQIEEHWRAETHELVTMVNRLQEDNRKLAKAAASQDNSSDVNSKTLSSEVDVNALHQSRACIEKLRDQLKLKDRELYVKHLEMEKMVDQLNRSSIQVKDLRKKLRMSQGQVRCLIDESADVITQFRGAQRELSSLRLKLGIAEKENKDLVLSCDDKPDLRNKAVYDLDDPNRPRFTTEELKEILRERNEYKARVSDLEEELNLYRPKPDASLEGEDDDDDAPVQGPLPFEPNDAPWKRSESGIRKLFRKLFSESNLTFLGSSPKHNSFSKISISNYTFQSSH